jgi:hypothetical protein
MVMRIKYSKEDLLIGFFIVLGISYPFLIALLIFFEDAMERKHTMEEVKAFYSFLLGLEECKEDKAFELSKILDEGLYKELGGEKGLISICQSYRKSYPSAMAKDKVLKDDELLVDLLVKEKGIIKKVASVRLYFERGEEGVKIKRVEYEKGG